MRSFNIVRRVTSRATINGAKGLLLEGQSKRWMSAPSSATSATVAKPGFGAEMRAKGFHHSTPNFSTDEFSHDVDPADLANDITTESALAVDYARDIYGPWLVMTDDLQGEIFVDHDHFVYYRPANGLGYGIGKLKVHDAGATGTAFTCQLESYVYQQAEAIAPQHGMTFDITGTVNRVTSKSSQYTTFSLVGVWRRTNRNEEVAEPPAPSRDGASVEKASAASSGQFNAAKLSPWDPATASKPFIPNAELQGVFAQVFPEHLRSDSHLKRSAAQKGAPENLHLVGDVTGKGATAHIDLAPYAVGNLPGIYYIPDYISEAEEAQMLKFIRGTPPELKSKLTKRTCQEWGCTMCSTCEKSFVSDANMPPWVQESIDMQVYDGIFTPTTFPNSVRIHEYEQGEGIGPHCDGPIYVPLVTVLSLASSSVMSFYPKQPLYEQNPMNHYNDTFKFSEGEIGKQTPLQSVVMEPRSLLIFSGVGYYHYPHGVSDKAEDVLKPELIGEVVNRKFLRDPEVASIPRTYRVSITTRNLLTRCNHQPARAEYAMKRAWYLYNHLPIPKELYSPPPHPLLPVTAAGDAVCGLDKASLSVDSFPSHRAGTHIEASVEVLKAVEDLRVGQEALRKDIEELKQLVAVSIAPQKTFQTDTATVLNHLSSSVLELENKLDEILEEKERVAGQRD